MQEHRLKKSKECQRIVRRKYLVMFGALFCSFFASLRRGKKASVCLQAPLEETCPGTLLWAQTFTRNNEFIYLLFFNSGYLELTKNFVCNIAATDANVLKRTLFVSGDRASAVDLDNFQEGLNICVRPFSGMQSATFGTYAYFRLTLERLYIQNNLIQFGVHVMVIEADATWFSDKVTEFLASKLSQYDFISADDYGKEHKHVISAGFLCTKSTSSTRLFFQKYVEEYAKALAVHEHKTGEIARTGEQWLMSNKLLETNFKILWLEECDFMRGSWYDDAGLRNRCASPLVLQNNYIEGNFRKIERAKLWGHWFLKSDGSCVHD